MKYSCRFINIEFCAFVSQTYVVFNVCNFCIGIDIAPILIIRFCSSLSLELLIIKADFNIEVLQNATHQQNSGN